MHRLGVGAGRDHARHDVQRVAFEVPGVVERRVERCGELRLAAGDRRDAAAALAGVAGRQG